MTFSEKLLSLRRRRGLSQDQLAELLGVSRQSVSKWESQQTLPEPGKLILISEIFGVSLDRLLKEDLPLEDAEPAPEERQCTRCGQSIRADSRFCAYCGLAFFPAPESEPAPVLETDSTPTSALDDISESEKPSDSASASYQSQPRIVFKVFGIFCLVLASIYALFGLMEPLLFGIACFFGVLSSMFFLLVHSSRHDPHLFLRGHATRLRKSVFVPLSIIIAFTVLALVCALCSPAETAAPTPPSAAASITLADVQRWYDTQMPKVSQALLQYAQSIDGISVLNVTESKFLFGEQLDSCNCHYTLYFTCRIDGQNCTGEARAFLTYQSSELNWYHFEIFRDADFQTVVEHYDDGAEKVEEAHYQALIALYG